MNPPANVNKQNFSPPFDNEIFRSIVKKSILQSRLTVIAAIGEAIRQRAAEGHAPRAFVQASAAGVYGDRGTEELSDNLAGPAQVGRGRDFRTTCCVAIEEAAAARWRRNRRVRSVRVRAVSAVSSHV